MLRCAGDGRAALAAHELLPLERVQELVEPPRLDAGERRERVRPERPSRCTAASCSSPSPSAGSRSMRAAMIPCTVSGSRSSTLDARLAASGRTPRRRAGCRPPARERLLVSASSTRPLEQRQDEPRGLLVVERGERDGASRFACRRPSRGGARAARAGPCRRRGAARRRPSRRARRRSRAGRRRPSGGPRTTSTSGRCSASASRNRRQAANASLARVAVRRPPRASPTSGRRCALDPAPLARRPTTSLDRARELRSRRRRRCPTRGSPPAP